MNGKWRQKQKVTDVHSIMLAVYINLFPVIDAADYFY